MNIKRLSAAIAAILCCTAMPVYNTVQPGMTQTAFAADMSDEIGTTNLYINCFDDTNDPDHEANTPVKEGYTVKVTTIDGKTHTAVTDQDGQVSFENIVAGNCNIEFIGSNGSDSKTYKDMSSQITLTKNITMTFTLYTHEVTAKSMLVVDFCAKGENGTTDISKKYSPIGASVTVTNIESGTSYTETCGEDGTVKFNDIEEGRYSLKINSLPEGYAMLLVSATMSNSVKKNSTLTFHVPIAVDELVDTTLTFVIEKVSVIGDMGDIDPTEIRYNLCKKTGDAYNTVATFTYDDLTNRKAIYQMSAYERTQSWKIVMTNSEKSGYTVTETVFPDLTDHKTASTMTICLAQPRLITNNITINGPADDEILLYLKSNPANENFTIKDKIPSNGTLTLKNIPFGTYIVHDNTIGEQTTITVNEDEKTQTITLPSKNENYVQKYYIYDVYDNLIVEKDGTFEDIVKPETQGNRDHIYRVVCEEGYPDANIGTAIKLQYVRIAADGTISNLPDTPLGDANLDGSFNVADAVALQKFLLNDTPNNCINWQSIDLDCDSALTVFDLCVMKQALVKKLGL